MNENDTRMMRRLDAAETIQCAAAMLYGGEASEYVLNRVHGWIDQDHNSGLDCWLQFLDALQNLPEDECLRKAIALLPSILNGEWGDREEEETRETQWFYEKEAEEQAAYLAWWETA